MVILYNESDQFTGEISSLVMFLGGGNLLWVNLFKMKLASSVVIIFAKLETFDADMRHTVLQMCALCLYLKRGHLLGEWRERVSAWLKTVYDVIGKRADTAVAAKIYLHLILTHLKTPLDFCSGDLINILTISHKTFNFFRDRTNDRVATDFFFLMSYLLVYHSWRQNLFRFQSLMCSMEFPVDLTKLLFQELATYQQQQVLKNKYVQISPFL